jgi:hypothetical protein
MKKAIITGDVIHSTKMSIQNRDWLIKEIENKLNTLYKSPLIMQSEIYRGDSFQCQVKSKLGLKTALVLKTFIKSLRSEDFFDSKEEFDVRLSLGIGEVTSNSIKLGMSDGEAFHLSGRKLDEMKKQKITFAITTNDNFKDELAVESALMDFILSNTTALQCEVIYWKLHGNTEISIAEKLKIQQSAVNQRSTAGGWNVIEKVLKRYETMYDNE